MLMCGYATTHSLTIVRIS